MTPGEVVTGAEAARLARLITETWQEILGITGIGPDDDFLELGGDSIHAVRIVGRVEEALDIHLSVRAVLEARTIRLMTAHVQRALAVPE